MQGNQVIIPPPLTLPIKGGELEVLLFKVFLKRNPRGIPQAANLWPDDITS
jgi:hypothetical protein